MMNVTKITDLKKYAEGAVVELPPFGPGQPFVAKIKRPSLMTMAKRGEIPNSLLTTAESMFSGKTEPKDAVNGENLKNMFSLCDCIADACFVSPTW